jgi:hypothetical protein
LPEHVNMSAGYWMVHPTLPWAHRLTHRILACAEVRAIPDLQRRPLSAARRLRRLGRRWAVTGSLVRRSRSAVRSPA